MNLEKLLIQRLTPTALPPVRATEGSAGYDLFADIAEPVTIEPGETVLLGTGIAMALPGPELVGLVFARSGLGVKHGIVPANAVGVVDSDYRGELRVGLHNHSQERYTVQPQDRIAQLLILPVVTPRLEETETLPDTTRASGGWGSTGR
ncbi:MAG: dUTP diphosphatase [Provencibacterium sp.]|jgi:dUTP pyrophosphatase|nr:dUTP diphosphatase [Provencibacterium sp.]